MYIRTTAALMMAAGLIATTAVAQPAPNPTQQPNQGRQEQVPVFRVTVVGRTTPAINYRPRTRRDEGRLRRDALAAERRRHGAG